MRIGGIASSASASVTFRNSGLDGKNAMNSAISATLGTARPTLEVEIARNEPLPVWPRISPSGSAITSARPIATPHTFRCSQSSGRLWLPPTGDPRWFSRELKMKLIASPNSPRAAKVCVIAPPPASRA